MKTINSIKFPMEDHGSKSIKVDQARLKDRLHNVLKYFFFININKFLNVKCFKI